MRAEDVLGRVVLVTGKEEYLGARTVEEVRAVVRAHDPEAEISEATGADLTLATLRGEVALVTQEHHVFVGTVGENLRLPRPLATDDEVHAALTAVDADDWVRALPDGLDTIVGSGGHPLTEAQAQQLALARLVLADPA